MAATRSQQDAKDVVVDGTLDSSTASLSGHDHYRTDDEGRRVGSSSSDEALDDNYEVFKKAAEEAGTFDEAEVKRVVRKIDLRVVPVLFMTYFLQYLDKSALIWFPVWMLLLAPFSPGLEI